MIPRTYPSTYAVNGQQQMVGYYLGSVSGLTRWVDYIPVRLGQIAPGSENAYDKDGYIPVASLSSVAGLTPFKDYVPLYIDNTATDVWTTNIAGYIPVGLSGFGGASLALNFVDGSDTLDPRVTFSRASQATVTGPDGVLLVKANNTPRFDYDPVTLAPKGLLIEEQRTNLLTYSEQFDNAAWTKTRCSITANTIVAPDGTLTGDKLVIDTTASTNHNTFQNYSVTSGTTYTWVVYAKAAEISQINLRFSAQFPAGSTFFDLSAGTVTNVGTVTASSITPVGNGWYRCSFTQTASSSGSASAQIFLSVAGAITITTANGIDGAYIWGAQLEAGAFPTSYIKTVASQVTRSADVAVMTGANFSSWYNQSEGTLFADYYERALSASHQVLYASSGASSERITINVNSSNVLDAQVFTGGSDTFGGDYPNLSARDYKIALAYERNNAGISENGSSVTTDTSVALPVGISQMNIGTTVSGAQCLNSHIRRIAYYPRRLSNAELQSITS